MINKKAYRIQYYYRNNTISINFWDNDTEIYLKNSNEAPDELKMFLRSLFRYIKKARLKTIPSFIME